MAENLIQIGVEVDLKKLHAGLKQGASAVQEQTDDMGKQFEKLAKSTKSALEDVEKAAKLSGVTISEEMKGALEEIPKLIKGVGDVFSGGSILALVGVLLQAGIALKALYEDVVLLKGAKEEWLAINKKLSESEDTLDAKIRHNIVEHIRLTKGGAAAAHAAIAMADQEVVDFGKTVDQVLSGKKVDKLSDGLKKDFENLNHFTFAQLNTKIDDVGAAIKRAQDKVKEYQKSSDECTQSAEEGAAMGAIVFEIQKEKTEGEIQVLNELLKALQKVKTEHQGALDNDSGHAHELDVQAFEKAQQKQMESLRKGLQARKDALDAFHTLSAQDEVKYWDSILATHKLKGQNLKEVHALLLEAQKEAARKALADEVGQVDKNVAAAKAGSQQRIKLLDDEIAHMKSKGQDQTAEYAHLVDQRTRAVEDAAKKELKDEIEAVQQKAKVYKAGSAERVNIFHDEVEKLKSEKQTDTNEFKRMTDEESQAERDLAKVLENVAETERKSRGDHEEALKQQDLARLEFEHQLGQTSEAQYEKLLRDRVTAAYQAELKELAIKKRLYQQDPLEFTKVKAAIIKLNDKYHADIEKADQKAYLRQKAAFDKYFSQISSSFTSELNSWIQGTETISQAFSKMFQSMIMSMVQYLEQKAMKKAEEWIIEKLFSEKKAAQNVADATSNTAVAATEALSSAPWPFNIAAAAEVQGVGMGYTAEAGIVPFLETGGLVLATGLAVVHAGERVVPAVADTSERNFGEHTIHVHMNVNAIDSSSFKDTLGKHGHMIGELVTKAMKRKGMK